MTRSIASVIVVAMTVHAIWATPALTENQIIEDIKFLSQTSHGMKPSRLRALLVADLKKALNVTVCIFADCRLIAENRIEPMRDPKGCLDHLNSIFNRFGFGCDRRLLCCVRQSMCAPKCPLIYYCCEPRVRRARTYAALCPHQNDVIDATFNYTQNSWI